MAPGKTVSDSQCITCATCTSAHIVRLNATPSDGQVRSGTVMRPALVPRQASLRMRADGGYGERVSVRPV